MKYRWRLLLVLPCLFVGLSSSARAQMSAEEQLKTLRVPKGFEVSLFASEPMITNPSAIDVDTHGRVWVAEIQWYRAKAKQPPADKIKVLEDTDGDGKADKVTVFAEGVFAPMSICVAGTKVYVATSPDLWVYEDKDGDLKPDGAPTKLLTGFGGFNHDHGAHSLVLGPDHKWWMSHGDTGFNVKGTDGSNIQYKWGAMLRGELDGSKLETVAVNFRNPYELCVSSFGECFFSDNDNDGNESVRAGWIMEGGNYGCFGGPPGPKGFLPPGTPFGEHWHFRGHIPGYVPATLVTGFGSPCGICFYEGDAFGPKYKNAPLHCDCGPREVRIYRHQLAGFGMKATSETIVTTAGDNYFRPDDICAAPDGSLYISDWYDGGVGGHAYNDPDRGRIFRLTPKGKKLTRVGKPGPYNNIPDAIEGLKNPNLATQFLARERLLAEKQNSLPALRELLSDPEPNYRARALWVLAVLTRIDVSSFVEILKQQSSPDPAIRALAVRIVRRLLADTVQEYALKTGALPGQRPGATKQKTRPIELRMILSMADDPSPEVRREVLLAMPILARFNEDEVLDALIRMAATYDGTDRYHLEAIHIAAGERKPELSAQLDKAGAWTAERLPLMVALDPKAAAAALSEKLAAAGADVAEGKGLLDVATIMPSSDAGLGVLKLAANRSAKPELRRLALQKLDAGLASTWKGLAGDAQLAAALRPLLADRDLQVAALELAGKYSIAALGPDVLKLARAPGADSAARQRTVAVAAQLKPDGISDALRGLLTDPQSDVRQAALNALVDLQDVKTLKDMLASSGNKFAPDVQSQTIARLMTTSGGALMLFRMIESKGLSDKLKQEAIAKAVNHPDSNVRVLYERFIPHDQRLKRLGEAIKPDEILALKGDPKRGEQIFFQSSAAQCKNCHMVQGKGSTVGPDLSQIGKKYERASLLETILDPSKAIAPEYYAYLLETEQGQVFVGFLVEKTDQQVVLKDAQNQLIRVPAKQVAELVKTDKSLMPELVLRDVTAQDAADLLAYLSTLTEGTQSTTVFRVLGPFDATERNLDAALEPEKLVAAPDLKAEYAGLDGKKNRWEVVASETTAGFPAIDSVKYDQARGLRGNLVAHYFLVYAESASDQEVGLLLGSDDGCKVWVNGQEVHKNNVTRAIGFAQDRVRAKLKTGRNVIVIKVINGDGPGGVSLGITSSGLVQLKTE
ncbi:MAG: c-type cytochrome [Planctomycetes bacterium]|nr:c-type cytochrome [Planctomycetota bacterium]